MNLTFPVRELSITVQYLMFSCDSFVGCWMGICKELQCCESLLVCVCVRATCSHFKSS